MGLLLMSLLLSPLSLLNQQAQAARGRCLGQVLVFPGKAATLYLVSGPCLLDTPTRLVRTTVWW
jgi:hypothetical protein